MSAHVPRQMRPKIKGSVALGAFEIFLIFVLSFHMHVQTPVERISFPAKITNIRFLPGVLPQMFFQFRFHRKRLLTKLTHVFTQLREVMFFLVNVQQIRVFKILPADFTYVTVFPFVNGPFVNQHGAFPFESFIAQRASPLREIFPRFFRFHVRFPGFQFQMNRSFMQIHVFHVFETPRAKGTSVRGLFRVSCQMNAKRIRVGGAFPANVTRKIHLTRVMLQMLLQTCFPRELLPAIMTNHFKFLVDRFDVLLKGFRFVKRLTAQMTDAGFVMTRGMLIS